MDFRGPPEGTERAPGEVCGSQGVSSGGAGFEDLGIWLPSIGDQCKGSGAKALVNFAVLKGPADGIWTGNTWRDQSSNSTSGVRA